MTASLGSVEVDKNVEYVITVLVEDVHFVIMSSRDYLFLLAFVGIVVGFKVGGLTVTLSLFEEHFLADVTGDGSQGVEHFHGGGGLFALLEGGCYW